MPFNYYISSIVLQKQKCKYNIDIIWYFYSHTCVSKVFIQSIITIITQPWPNTYNSCFSRGNYVLLYGVKQIIEVLILYFHSWDTGVGGLKLSDQHLTLSTRLPSSYIYGFGENSHESYRHDLNFRTWGMFARDQWVGTGVITTLSLKYYHFRFVYLTV